jgi:hypothetical protein
MRVKKNNSLKPEEIKKQIFESVSLLQDANAFSNLNFNLLRKLKGTISDLRIDFCFDFFDKVFENTYFINACRIALTERVKSDNLFAPYSKEKSLEIRKQNLEEKKIILAGIILAVAPFFLFYENFSVVEIKTFKKKVRKSLFTLEDSLESFFSISRIVSFFQELICFNFFYRFSAFRIQKIT